MFSITLLRVIFFKDFIYLFMRDTERKREKQIHRKREKQAPCGEPDVRLDPGTPGSCPGPKVGAKPLIHPGIPLLRVLLRFSTLFSSPVSIFMTITLNSISDMLLISISFISFTVICHVLSFGSHSSVFSFCLCLFLH